jgi:hypothetical protein
LKAHSYPSTDQATPVPVDLLVYLGVPTSAVDALQLAFATEFTVSVNSVSTTNPPPRAALVRKHARSEVARQDQTLKEVAAELSVPVKGLREFIRALNLLPGRTWDKTVIGSTMRKPRGSGR